MSTPNAAKGSENPGVHMGARRWHHKNREQHPRKLEDAAMQLALVAEDVDEHVMDSGLAWRRQRLRDEILNVKMLVEEAREARRVR